MIIDGNGLLASSIGKYCDAFDDVYVFARGVSNSASEAEESYQRELHFLGKAIDQCYKYSKKLVYFSSGGAIYGHTNKIRKEDMQLLPVSRYGKNKLECEDKIVKSGVSFLILRLPNIVGPSGNINQLFPHLVNSVKTGRVDVYEDAARDLLDVDDMAWILSELLRKNVEDVILNVASGVEISILSLVNEINKYIGNELDINFIPGGDKQIFSIDRLSMLLPDLSFSNSYPLEIVRKYASEF